MFSRFCAKSEKMKRSNTKYCNLPQSSKKISTNHRLELWTSR